MSLLDTASLIVTPNGYKEGKLYSVIPSDGSGDMSVVRATTATRVNSAGLVELVPYNLLSWSQDFTNGWYAYLGSITATANYGTAPDGTNTSTRILFTSNNQIWAKAISGLTNVNGTFSVWIKGVAGQTIAISYGGTDNVVTLQSGWNRYSVTAVGTIDFIFIDTFGSTATDIEVWGGQVVEGSTAKDYQKTETRLNIPRLDYSNGTCPSLLVEPQRTNQYLKSNDFANWSNNNGTNTITPNYAISPDGIMNASRWVATGTGYRYNLYGLFTLGTTTVSIYAKRNNSGTQKFGFFLNGSGTVDYELNLTNEWQRFTYTFNLTNEYQGLSAEVGADVSIYGYQLEAGSYATSYIPTTSASVTRNADVISKTGISSLIGQTEGTLFVDVYRPNQASPFLFTLANSVGSNSYLNSIYIFQLPNDKMVVDCFVSGVKQFGIETSVGITNGRHKIAVAYKQNDAVVYLDGVLLGTDTSCNIPPFSAFEVNNVDIGSTSNFDINSVALWKTKLDNATLAQLTTI